MYERLVGSRDGERCVKKERSYIYSNTEEHDPKCSKLRDLLTENVLYIYTYWCLIQLFAIGCFLHHSFQCQINHTRPLKSPLQQVAQRIPNHACNHSTLPPEFPFTTGAAGRSEAHKGGPGAYKDDRRLADTKVSALSHLVEVTIGGVTESRKAEEAELSRLNGSTPVSLEMRWFSLPRHMQTKSSSQR